MNNSFFKAKSLVHKWENLTVDVSFTCPKGTMTCIVGPSGSGKSTILRIIAGLENTSSPDTHIYAGDKEITHLKSSKRSIGMVFQKPALFSHMKVWKNVAYGLECQGLSSKLCRIRAGEYLEKVGLKGFEDRWPDTLSGGEAQRVSLARTLIVTPEIVLFDEPLSALDAPLRKKLAADIKESQKTLNFTGIMVTHDIAEAKNMGDFIMLIKNGHITWQGKSNDFSEDMI